MEREAIPVSPDSLIPFRFSTAICPRSRPLSGTALLYRHIQPDGRHLAARETSSLHTEIWLDADHTESL